MMKAVQIRLVPGLVNLGALLKGDVAGHEFHGNQYSPGIVAAHEKYASVRDKNIPLAARSPNDKYAVSVGNKAAETRAFNHLAGEIEKQGLQIGITIQRLDAARDKSKANKVNLRSLLFKGDVAGHEFHGNQYSGGTGGLSPALESDIQERMRIANEESDGESHMTRADALQEFMQDSDDNEHYTHAYQKELRVLGVKLGVYRPVAATSVTTGGDASSTFKLGGVKYEFHSWDPLFAATNKVNLHSLLFKNLDRAAHQAATSPHNLKRPPTAAEARAGNYPKGHVRFAGLDVSIENPAGSKRKPEWPPMQAHYGYVRGTEGADGDHVDCFLRPSTPLDWDGTAYVIDQVNADGGFDEHKIMLGWDSQDAAEKAYLAHYPKGWALGPVTAMSLDELRAWLSGDTTQAIAKGDVAGHEFHGNQYQAGAAEIKAMSQDARDSLNPADAPGGWGAYNLYEAQTMLPKSSDKLKTVNERNSFTLHQDYHQIANVDGIHYGIAHYDDPDNEEGQAEDKDQHVYAYHRLDDPRSAMSETTIGANKENVPELIAHIRSTKVTKINLRSLLFKEDGGASTTTTGHTQSSSATSGLTAYGMIRSTLRRKLKTKEKRV